MARLEEESKDRENNAAIVSLMISRTTKVEQ